MNKKEQQSTESAERTQAETKSAESSAAESCHADSSAAEMPEQKSAEESAGTVSADKLPELQKELTELKDQYLRKCADFDNYRKRMIREKQEAFDYANTNLLTDLVAILDDFDRALAAGADAQSQNSDPAAVIDGIKMINKQLRGLLDAKYNLTSYGEKGDAFDHDRHEAIASVPAAVEEPVCAEIYLKGYMLKDRVIRPAKVLVHMPDGNAPAADGAEKETASADENNHSEQL
ncbi:MAG: nucleotide exchange factor GrpE [Bacteroides sp.]|nr:nucleotide exchange factor GrpE [Prevotella sp.]MCM1407460.1 nucleotide exchange factor GrpE [Treponema brennaborense]MCM1469950.1 nucleotide exchange factor GrpE [Bacteroides sp.]